MKNSIMQSITSLPPLSKTIIDINSVYSDEESGIHDLSSVIEPDPMIVANLLKTANSSLYGFGKQIKNVAQAVSLFGMSVTRSIAIGHAVRMLLNVDMKAYGITGEEFANISSNQAKLITSWYSKIDKKKADDLYFAALLQESGKIIISNNLIQEDEDISFKSEITHSHDIATVEKSYMEVSSAEVTSSIFEHWGFDKSLIEMIKYSDNPSIAPDEVKEYSTALNIVKTIVSINDAFSEQSINFGLKKALDAGYNVSLIKDSIDEMLEIIEGNK